MISILSQRRRSDPLERELPELREPDELFPDEELRDGADGLETLGLLDDPLDERTEGAELRLLPEDEDDASLRRVLSDEPEAARPMTSQTDELRDDVRVRPAVDARSLEAPERGRVKSIDGLLVDVVVRPAVDRSPITAVRLSGVVTAPERLVPEPRATS